MNIAENEACRKVYCLYDWQYPPLFDAKVTTRDDYNFGYKMKGSSTKFRSITVRHQADRWRTKPKVSEGRRPTGTAIELGNSREFPQS